MVFKWANFIRKERFWFFLSMWSTTKNITLFLTSNGTKYDKEEFYNKKKANETANWKHVGWSTLLLLKGIQSLQTNQNRTIKTIKRK